jgi:signal transduction histidine kinase/FixJ family two-component response regulator/HPt (histidine-containing phosphotransfer) domain-containing protein
MSEIHAFIEKLRRPLYVQILFIVLAFLGMIFLSYIFSRNIVRANLINNTENVLAFGEAKLEADLREPRTTLDIISEMVRDIIIEGGGIDELQKNFNKLADYTREEFGSSSDSNLNGFYGYFETLGDEPVFIDSLNRALPDDFSPRTLPWYQAAVLAGNRIAVTHPYLNQDTGEISFAYTHRIYDDAGLPLGIVCLDVRINDTLENIVETALAQGGFGMLLSQDLTIIAHPNKEFVGLNAANPSVNISKFIDELRAGHDIYERELTSYTGEPSVAFFRKLPNGFYIGLVTPKIPYYQSVRTMTAVLTAFGVLLAVGLIFILTKMIRIDDAKEKANMESFHKSVFLANMSHEIRTPMNAIIGIMEIQLQKEELDPDTKEAFGKIYESGNLLLNIINDILDFSKIAEGKMEIVPFRYDIPSLINDTTQLNSLRCESKPINFIVSVDPDTPLELAGDGIRVRQILNNLLSNAFKYTDEGEVELSVFSEPAADGGEGPSEDVIIVLRVRDTGQGISQEHIGKLFDDYMRFNRDINYTVTGTGLGLSITKRLVNLMNGEISVESQPGKGSVFTVRLPQKRLGDAVCGEENAQRLRDFDFHSTVITKKTQIVREYMPYGSVLVVDDVKSNLFVARGLLSPYGLQIDVVDSGVQAVEKIKDGNVYDVIFMDHMMPVMDGIETTRIIRGTGYDRPIVALTANALVGQAEMFMQNGFDAFIPKPIDSRRLNTVLHEFIRDKKPPEIVEAARQERLKKDVKGKGTAEKKTKRPELEKYFLIDAVNAVKKLEEIYAKTNAPVGKDIESYKITVHGMKSALANIGETELCETARRLEQAAIEKNLAAMSQETPAFTDALKSLIKKLSPAKDTNDTHITEEDAAYLREKLLEIKTACQTIDKKTAKAAVKDLKQKEWPRGINDVLDEISVHLLHSDFEKAQVLAENTVV